MDKAAILQAQLSQIPATPDAAYRAYTFALFSIQVPLKRHELAFEAFIHAYPTINHAEALSYPAIEWEFRSLGLNLCGQKAGAFHRALPVLREFLSVAWPLSDKDARAWVAANLPGLSYAKASFFLMLMGRLGVGCLDVHMLKLLKTGRVAAPKHRGPYEAIEKKLGPKAGLSQWLRWIDFMGVPGVGHQVYFTAQGVSSP